MNSFVIYFPNSILYGKWSGVAGGGAGKNSGKLNQEGHTTVG
jgi:hypothetical protein